MNDHAALQAVPLGCVGAPVLQLTRAAELPRSEPLDEPATLWSSGSCSTCRRPIVVALRVHRGDGRLIVLDHPVADPTPSVHRCRR